MGDLTEVGEQIWPFMRCLKNKKPNADFEQADWLRDFLYIKLPKKLSRNRENIVEIVTHSLTGWR